MNPCKRIHDVCKSHLYLDVDQGKEKCENKKIKIFFTKGTLFSTFQKFGKTLRCITKGVEYKMWVCRLTKSLIFDS